MSNTEDNNGQQLGGSGEMTTRKKECTSCEQHNVDNITEGIDSVAILDMSTCASCGKEGNNEDMNTCNRCKMVKYCNAACKKKHRSKHKKACDRRVAELHDEQLFKEVEPGECPICMIPILQISQAQFWACCGKGICHGCIYSMMESEGGGELCPYCRTPPSKSNREEIKRLNKLMNNGNGEAFNTLGIAYSKEALGLSRDYSKANELYLKGGELGCSTAYFNLGNNYRDGSGVEVDEKMAKHYHELATIGGSVHARHNLACIEWNVGNYDRGMRHFLLAARAGYELSLDSVKVGFKCGLITKDEYANTLRAYQKIHDEMKSDARVKVVESCTSTYDLPQGSNR